jgi:hypothetical protein
MMKFPIAIQKPRYYSGEEPPARSKHRGSLVAVIGWGRERPMSTPETSCRGTASKSWIMRVISPMKNGA